MRTRRLLPALALALALLPCASAHAQHVGEARLVTCDLQARTATFEGRMTEGEAGERLQMRFTLQVFTRERPRWARLAAPGFDVWSTAEPAADRYLYTKRVQGLLEGARYRAIVRFRWLDAAGDVLASDRRVTPACRQQGGTAALHWES